MVKFVLVSLEGNIGAGKSTLFNMIKKEFPDSLFLNEPLEMWQNVNNQPNANILEKFYQEPTRWSYSFQVYAYQSRLMEWDRQYKQFEKDFNSRLSDFQSPMKEDQLTQDGSEQKESSQEIVFVFTERSIQSSRTLFFRLLQRMGFINEVEGHMYEQFYAWIMSNYQKYSVDQVIYINTPAAECYNRLKKRARNEEVGVSLEYLQQLEQRHLDWFNEEKGSFEVLSIDATENYISDEAVQKRVVKQIQDCVSQLRTKFEQIK